MRPEAPSLTHAAETPAPAPPSAPLVERPPYLWALVAALAVFALYAFTLAPTTAFWDTSEYIATAHILGIPHPPGNPLFVMLARAWEMMLAPFGLSAAVRVNLFSALMGAASAGFWFLVANRVLGYFTPSVRVRRLGAAAGVLMSATAFTVWNQSNVNEKVYTVSLLTIAFLSWMAFLWRDHVESHVAVGAGAPRRRWHDDNVLVLMAYLLALSVANHLMAFLAAPALLVFVLLVKPRALLSWKLYVFAAVFAVVGLSANLFLPIRSGLDPIINEAQPSCPQADGTGTDVVGSLVSIVTFGAAGCEDLSASLQREQYQKPSWLDPAQRQAPLFAQLANYFQYFDWQWARSVQGNVGYMPPLRMMITLLFLGLGAYGAYEHWRRDRKSFAYLGVLFATLSFGLVMYMNFKYGYMQARQMGLSAEMGEVRERDYFFLVSFSMWGLWCGIGLTAAWLGVRETVRSRGAHLAAAVALGMVALVPLVGNWKYASRQGDVAAREWAFNMLQSVEPYGVLFTNGDNDTFPLWYLQEVEGIRRDVTVIVMSYLNTDWYARQLRDLTRPCPTPDAWRADDTRITCQRAYEPDGPGTPEFYGNPAPPKATILPLDDGQIQATAAAGYIMLPRDEVFEARGVRTTFEQGRPLMAADQFALAIIKNAWGDRPIHFASTTYAHLDLGLAEHVARHGFSQKLVAPDEREGLLPMPLGSQYDPGLGAFADVERHRALMTELAAGRREVPERGFWVDDATRNIPAQHAYGLYALAAFERMLGNTAAEQAALAEAEAWTQLTRN